MRNPIWWAVLVGLLWGPMAPTLADSYTQSVPVLVIVESPSSSSLDMPEALEADRVDPLEGAVVTTIQDGDSTTILYTKTE